MITSETPRLLISQQRKQSIKVIIMSIPAQRGRRANWENGRLVRCMGRTWTVHGTDETSVLPVKAPRGPWPHWRRGKRLVGVHLSGL